MGVVANLLVKISGDSSELRKELASTRKQIKTAFGNEAIKASQKTLKHVKLLTLGFVGLGAASIKMAADVQQTRTAIVTLLKSTEEADKLLKDVKYFAATTPFEFKGLAQASQQMIAFGFKAKAVVPILRTVGDAVSGLGGNQEAMDSIVRVLGRVQTMGKVTSMELMQLARQGINAYQYLADATGKSTAQVREDMKKGSISSSQAIQAIVLGMNKQFAGGMENQSKTLMGLWATVRENVTGVMRQIGASISEGFSLEKTFGEFSDWLSKFTVAVEGSGFKKAIKDMVPDSLILSIIAIAGSIIGRMIPAMVLATKAAWALNAALIKTQILTGGIMIAVGFLATELTGYTNVTKNATKKLQDSFAASGQKDRSKSRVTGNDRSRRARTTTPSNNGQKTVEETTAEVKKMDDGLQEALDTLNKVNAAFGDDSTAGKATEKAINAYNQLQKQAESTSKSIETAWLDMTGSQRDILDAWHRDQLAELEKSKAVSVNYTRDRTRLEETFQEKLRQLMNTEAKERAATIKEITDQYKGMYDKLSEMGLKGSEKDLFGLKKAADDDVKSVSDYFDKLTADYTAATEAQKQNIINGLKEAGVAYKVIAGDMLGFSDEKASYEAKRFKQYQNDKVNYYRQCKDIQADIDEAYNQLSLEKLQETLTAENAVRLGNMEATKTEMDTYMQAMQDAYAPISLMFANMAETFRTGFSEALSDIVMGVSSLSEAFESLGKSMLKVVVDYYAKQLAGKLMLALFGKKALAEETVASVAAGKAVAAAWAAAAANVSLASFGANAAPASAGISATHALTQSLSVVGLAEGGLATGPTLAMIGEGKYKEAVVPLSDRVFDRLADGINSAGGKGGATNINVYGDINNASDEDRILGRLFDNANYALMGA